MRYIYRQITQESGRVFPEVKPVNIRKLPIIIPESKKDRLLMEKINILTMELRINYSREKKIELDEIVFDLYDITENERKTIESVNQ